MAFNPRVCIKAVRLCLLAAEAQGLDLKAVQHDYEINQSLLSDPYARVPHALVSRLFEELPNRTGDSAFGLHAAERWHAQTLDAFDGAMHNCRTLGDVFTLLSRFVRLMHEAGRIEIERQGDKVRIIERWMPPATVPRHFSEMVMAMWVLRWRRLSGGSLAPREVTFMHPAPPELGEHERILGMRPLFGAAAHSMLLDAASLEMPVVGAEPVLGRVLERHLQDELSRLPPPDDLLAAAAHAAREALNDPDINIDRMARRLHISQRTLQRRLRLAGTSFQELIEQARREQALRLLHDQRLTLSEVAFKTGYSEMSTFYRAFRRWTGKTPGEYRDATGS